MLCWGRVQHSLSRVEPGECRCKGILCTASPRDADEAGLIYPHVRRSSSSSRALCNGDAQPEAAHKADAGPDSDGSLLEALRGSLVVNGLECKLSCSSSKVSAASGLPMGPRFTCHSLVHWLLLGCSPLLGRLVQAAGPKALHPQKRWDAVTGSSG